ncbi:MAG: RNase adapter RapZ [Microthrixaceae bacterium]|nr:RNase adapter RapZ [Microthrixaceae bacterium]MCB9387738.1 RNase adapter RapZ [Microthrixaceae bacterium]MCO5319812.1 RNase adapter RapZ [Microthrixaceae bacterium]
MVEVLLIAGMSGAGRTQAGNTLEDLGWFVIDNMPVELIPKVAELGRFSGGSAGLALVTGTGDDIGALSPAVEELRGSGASVHTLFLEASTPVLVRRYRDTRRRHPLLGLTASTEAAIDEERRLLSGVRERADMVIDTSDMNIHDLRRRITEMFANPEDTRTQITLLSFGFKHGVPADADLLFDCRFLPNPHWEEGLRDLTGLDDEVQHYVTDSDLATDFISRTEHLLDLLVPAYETEGKSVLTIAFGCTGGHHRSVTLAERFAGILRDKGFSPRVRHRDIER